MRFTGALCAWGFATTLIVWACAPRERQFDPSDDGSGGATMTVGGSAGVDGAAGAGMDRDTSSSCPPGYFDCNGDPSDGCEATDVPLLEPPRPLAPFRGAYTGSLHAPAAAKTLRPTVEYAAVPGVCGDVRYEIVFDDSCKPGKLETCPFDTPELVDVTEDTRYEPPSDLPVRQTPPVGALYTWRVRACDASERCSDWSAPSYLHVGRTEQDLNGDGYADVLARSSMGTEVFFGGVNFNGQADARLAAGYYEAFVGDLNADGFADVAGNIEGWEDCSSVGGVTKVIYGGPDLANVEEQVLCRTSGSPSVERHHAEVGDLNGDGFDDLAVAWGYNSTEASLMIFSGGDQVAAEPATEASVATPGLPYPLNRGFQAIRGRGDYDADGISDVVVVTASTGEIRGRYYVLLGQAELSRSFDIEIDDETCFHPRWLEKAGDVNQDGKDDWVILCVEADLESHRLAFLLGGTPAEGALDHRWTTDLALTSTSSLLDFDGDGVPEFLVGVSSAHPAVWRPDSDQAEVDRYSRVNVGTRIDVADHNGDGRPDVVFGGGDGVVLRAGSSLSFNVVPTELRTPGDATGGLTLCF